MTPVFSSPPNPHAFRHQVWEIVKKIPAGKVATYGQIAGMISFPDGQSATDYRAVSPRWVGGAMAGSPPDVPWQRVINSQGKISLRGSAGEEQRNLLESEGVVFDANGKIDLKKFQWKH